MQSTRYCAFARLDHDTPDNERVYFGEKVLSLCKETFQITDIVKEKAFEFEDTGIKPIDALHLAIAVTNKIKYLCTCDDKFLNDARKLKNIGTKIVLPTELIKEVVK